LKKKLRGTVQYLIAEWILLEFDILQYQKFQNYILFLPIHILLFQPPIQWVPGAFSLGVKRPGRKADHSPPSSAEVEE